MLLYFCIVKKLGKYSKPPAITPSSTTYHLKYWLAPRVLGWQFWYFQCKPNPKEDISGRLEVQLGLHWINKWTILFANLTRAKMTFSRLHGGAHDHPTTAPGMFPYRQKKISERPNDQNAKVALRMSVKLIFLKCNQHNLGWLLAKKVKKYVFLWIRHLTPFWCKWQRSATISGRLGVFIRNTFFRLSGHQANPFD